MYELKKYHGDKVMSLTYEDEIKSFSVGILSPGEYRFGAIRKEIYRVTSGVIKASVGNSEIWTTYEKNDEFTVPSQKNFKLSVDDVSTYICYYE